MTDARIWHARRRGALVARVLSRSWCDSTSAPDLSPSDVALVSPVLLDSPAAALAWNKLRNALPEHPLLPAFRDAYRFSALRSQMRALDLEEALARVHRAGIDPIVHKGWATARLYPHPEMRAYSDIDLFVPPAQIESAQAALKIPPPIGCPIDLEHSELAALDSIDFETLYTRSRLIEPAPRTVRILAPEDHLRSLCIHCLKHGVASPLWLVDVAVTIEAASPNFDWDLCIGARLPQANWVRSALSLAHRLLGADIRNTPIPRFERQLPAWLVRSVLRRWSRPPVPAPLPRLASVLSSKTGILEALAWRWPSAGQTTIDANAMFTRFPNLHLQLQSLFAPAKLKLFVLELPAVWRQARQPGSGTRKSLD